MSDSKVPQHLKGEKVLNDEGNGFKIGDAFRFFLPISNRNWWICDKFHELIRTLRHFVGFSPSKIPFVARRNVCSEFIRLQPLQASTWPLQKLKAWAANICHSWQNLESLMCSVSAFKGKCNDRI